MNILICGATGFVGRHLTRSLQASGHRVFRAVRNPQGAQDIAADFRIDANQAAWLPRLQNMDAVINAVGVLRESKNNPMQRLHHDTPLALFAACREAGVKRIVHVSALGVDSGLPVPYFLTRQAAEQALQAMPDNVRWLCLRPSVIYGEDGASAQMFRRLAALPLHVLPMGGVQTLQPVHIEDLCDAVVRWMDDEDARSQLVAAVGAEPATMRAMLDSYRTQLGHGRALHIAIPRPLVRLMARLGDLTPTSPLCSDTLAMMATSNTADATQFSGLLGRMPRSYREFIA